MTGVTIDSLRVGSILRLSRSPDFLGVGEVDQGSATELVVGSFARQNKADLPGPSLLLCMSDGSEIRTGLFPNNRTKGMGEAASISQWGL